MAYDPVYFPVQVEKGKTYDPGKDGRGRTCRATFKPWWTSNTFIQQRGSYSHNAIDIMAPLGARVVAPVSGKIMERWRYMGEDRPGAGSSPAGGFYARLVDDLGYEHFFSHMLKRPEVRPGQRVDAGDLIGYVGQSGNAASTCPHLHYQVRNPRGAAVNPIPKLTVLFEQEGWLHEGRRLGPWIGAGAAFAAGVGVLWLWLGRD